MRKFIARHNRQLIVGLAMIVILAVIVGGLWATNIFGWRIWRVQEAQDFIGASLPAGASDIQFATRNQYTRIIWLRFSMPSNSDLAPFLTQMQIMTALKAGFTPFPAVNPQEAPITWWQPFASQNYSGVYWNTGTKAVEILVDNTDSSRQVVYLRAYAFAQN
jgi:hypothetical protein